jgi:hypothetical protein
MIEWRSAPGGISNGRHASYAAGGIHLRTRALNSSGVREAAGQACRHALSELGHHEDLVSQNAKRCAP